MTNKKNILKKRGLGKGLGALIPDINEEETKKGHNPDGFLKISTIAISANPYQPRLKFSETEIEELASSIKEYGILQPVLVRKAPDKDDHFQIIAGERRVRAAKKAGLLEIPVIIRDIDNEKMLQISIVENIQRENLNPVEEAKAYKRLVSEFSYTQENLSQIVGKSRSAIANSLRLLNLPDNILDSISDGLITGGHAKALLGAKDDNIQYKVFYEILDKKLNVRQTEALIKNLNENSLQKEKIKPITPPEFNDMAKRLTGIIGSNVKIMSKGSDNGKIEIKFKTRDELERIFTNLKNSLEEKN